MSPTCYCHCLGKFSYVSMDTARSQLNAKDCQKSFLAILFISIHSIFQLKNICDPIVAALPVAFSRGPVTCDLVPASSACHSILILSG